MEFARKILLKIFGQLAIAATNKHEIKVVAIAGHKNSEIVRELVYNALSPLVNTRRNTKRIWWDLSIPLAVLGLSDRQRTLFEWIKLIAKALYVLITNKSQSHVLILNLDTIHASTQMYWASFLKPDVLLVLDKRGDEWADLIHKTSGGKVIEEVEIKDVPFISGVPQRYVALSIAAAKELGYDEAEIRYNILKFDMPRSVIEQIAKNMRDGKF